MDDIKGKYRFPRTDAFRNISQTNYTMTETETGVFVETEMREKEMRKRGMNGWRGDKEWENGGNEKCGQKSNVTGKLLPFF